MKPPDFSELGVVAGVEVGEGMSDTGMVTLGAETEVDMEDEDWEVVEVVTVVAAALLVNPEIWSPGIGRAGGARKIIKIIPFIPFHFLQAYPQPFFSFVFGRNHYRKKFSVSH